MNLLLFSCTGGQPSGFQRAHLRETRLFLPAWRWWREGRGARAARSATRGVEPTPAEQTSRRRAHSRRLDYCGSRLPSSDTVNIRGGRIRWPLFVELQYKQKRRFSQLITGSYIFAVFVYILLSTDLITVTDQYYTDFTYVFFLLG